jgi:hypothetical protein
MKHNINTNTGTCSICCLTSASGFTRECLGKPIHKLTMQAVANGEIDYYDGAFHSTQTNEETIADVIKSVANRNGIRVEIHEPRMHRGSAEADNRDDRVTKPVDLSAYGAMEKFINDSMAATREPEEYVLSKDEIEFLKQIHKHPITKRVIADLRLTKDQFIMLLGLKKAGYVYASVDDDKTWIVTSKAKAYLESLSEPATLVMTTNGIALLTILTEEAVNNDEVTDDEDMVAAANLLIGFIIY